MRGRLDPAHLTLWSLSLFQYLLENNRMVNIFTDLYYLTFVQELNKMLSGWQPTVLPNSECRGHGVEGTLLGMQVPEAAEGTSLCQGHQDAQGSLEAGPRPHALVCSGLRPSSRPAAACAFPDTVFSRVEEEHLWECKQLGVYSPFVLLNTLMFFNTKFFGLQTAEEHMQLSFTNVVRQSRKCATPRGSAKVVSIRYYAPVRHQKGRGRGCLLLPPPSPRPCPPTPGSL